MHRSIPMKDLESARLEALLEEIEQAWKEEADLSVAGRIAQEYPDYAKDVRAFVAAMLDEELGSDPDPDAMAASATRTHELVETHGYRLLEAAGGTVEGTAAVAAVPSGAPGTILELLRVRTGLRASKIASALDVTTAFLHGLGQCLSVPPRAAEELARSAHAAFGVAIEEVRAVLLRPHGATVLASSDTAQPAEPLTYLEVVERAGLRADRTEAWRGYHEEAQ
jgi:hypothetical protein